VRRSSVVVVVGIWASSLRAVVAQPGGVALAPLPSAPTPIAMPAPTATVDEPAPRALAPELAMLDPIADRSKLELELTYGGGHGGPDLQPRVHAQLVGPGHVGGYVALGATKSLEQNETLQLPPPRDHELTVGDLELGGLYRPTLSPELDLGLRVGLVLPTIDENIAMNYERATLQARPGDLVTARPATSLRLGASPTFTSGRTFARFD